MTFLILLFSLGSPFFIFLDYHKRHNIHKAIIYVVAFFVLWKYVLSWIIIHYGLYFAGSIPFLMFAFLVFARKPRDKS